MYGKLLLGAVGSFVSLGLAAPAGADPAGADPVNTVGSVAAPQPGAVPAFLAAARAGGVTGADPAMLADGYSVCNQLWNLQAPGTQVAANLVRDHPTVTSAEAGQFVLAAVNSLCPVPGTYDYWAYSTS
jgi:Protein of unknown function (DUF732)